MKNSGRLLFALSLSTLLLSACGGDSDSTSNPGSAANTPGQITTDETKINTFSSIGNINSEGALVVDPAIDDGQFDLNWDVESTSIYRVDMYVSKDASLSKTDDQLFYGSNCGHTPTGTALSCGKIASIDCRFEANNRISCGDGVYVNNGVNLIDYFTGLPSDDYLIIEACGIDSLCDQKAFKITFN